MKPERVHPNCGSIKPLKKICLVLVSAIWLTEAAFALEVNEDGRMLIEESERSFQKDISGRPVNTDPVLTAYIGGVIERLAPKDKALPDGVALEAVILESPQPELFSYASGRVVLTTGLILALENEAQLAGVLSREVAGAQEGYCISLYQEIRAAEKRQQRRASAAAFLGSLLDAAVDFSVQYASYEISDRWFNDEITYRETMAAMAGIAAAETTYYSIKDLVAGIPEKDEKGQRVDPRLRIEPVADAQGMIYTASAGYDCRQTADGWDHLYRVKKRMLQEQAAAMGPWADEMRQARELMEMNLERIRKSIGATGLARTRGSIPAERSEFTRHLSTLAEVKAAEKGKKPSLGLQSFQSFLQQFFVPRAEALMAEEEYEKAHAIFSALWTGGIETAPVAYAVAKSMLGDFAFGAGEAEKEAAEKAYLHAASLDSTFPLPHKGLGELYEDWDRYGDAADAYERYLKLNPDADDRERISRKIKTCRKRADR